MVASAIARAKLRQLYAGLETSGKSLWEVLLAANDAAVSAVQSGRAITQSSGNGLAVVYTLIGGFSPLDAVELVDHLITRYEAAKAVCKESDEEIYNEMLLNLEPVTESYSDFSQLSRV